MLCVRWETRVQPHPNPHTSSPPCSGVAACLDAVAAQGAEVMVATHNQASVEAAVGGMAARGLAPGSGVYFGQVGGC